MRRGEVLIHMADEQPSCEALCQQHYGRVLQLCRVLLVDRDEAEETAQEVFVKMVCEYQAQSTIRSWEAWLTRVTVNACRDRRRSGWWKWWREAHSEFHEIDWPSTLATPEEHALKGETREQIWRCIRALSARQREVFALRRIEGWSNEEAAEFLGLSTGSVKRHLFHALRHLAKALGERS